MSDYHETEEYKAAEAERVDSMNAWKRAVAHGWHFCKVSKTGNKLFAWLRSIANRSKCHSGWRVSYMHPDGTGRLVAFIFDGLEGKENATFIAHAPAVLDGMFKAYDALRDSSRATIKEKDAQIATLQRRVEELENENTHLRAALANSKDPCIYCQLPADEMHKCKQGFPGCGRADDMMGCPEFGAQLALYEAQQRIAELEARPTEADLLAVAERAAGLMLESHDVASLKRHPEGDPLCWNEAEERTRAAAQAVAEWRNTYKPDTETGNGIAVVKEKP